MDTKPSAEILGVYPVDAVEPCHLIELKISNFIGKLDMREFTQETPGLPPDEWEVPWDERVLNPLGTREHEVDYEPPHLECIGTLRLTLFFHKLDLVRPLLTPFGPLALPVPTAKPMRLNFLEYEAPW